MGQDVTLLYEVSETTLSSNGDIPTRQSLHCI